MSLTLSLRLLIPTAVLLLACATSGVAQDVFAGPFSSSTNVKTEYGAVGDGITDDTAALQRALTLVGHDGPSRYAVFAARRVPHYELVKHRPSPCHSPDRTRSIARARIPGTGPPKRRCSSRPPWVNPASPASPGTALNAQARPSSIRLGGFPLLRFLRERTRR